MFMISLKLAFVHFDTPLPPVFMNTYLLANCQDEMLITYFSVSPFFVNVCYQYLYQNSFYVLLIYLPIL